MRKGKGKGKEVPGDYLEIVEPAHRVGVTGIQLERHVNVEIGGDNVNGDAFNEKSKTLDPHRLTRAYAQSIHQVIKSLVRSLAISFDINRSAYCLRSLNMFARLSRYNLLGNILFYAILYGNFRCKILYHTGISLVFVMTIQKLRRTERERGSWGTSDEEHISLSIIMSGQGRDPMGFWYVDFQWFRNKTEMITAQHQQIIDTLSEMRAHGTMLAAPAVQIDPAI
ncbi:hypothetical protein Scep_019468 [Stephania cephalantha]|uniref:Uncharacterized protein n=1 Tax=Stephania cephalantha TaxID=152367 RepID=A0AAP0IAQ8_9MAGN